jgi:hypothetical protein
MKILFMNLFAIQRVYANQVLKQLYIKDMYTHFYGISSEMPAFYLSLVYEAVRNGTIIS